MTHELKTWQEYMMDIATGKKTFEVRNNDRNFQVGDELILKGWQPLGYSRVSPSEMTGEYTGQIIDAEVTYILKGGQFGIAYGYVVMGIEVNDYNF